MLAASAVQGLAVQHDGVRVSTRNVRTKQRCTARKPPWRLADKSTPSTPCAREVRLKLRGFHVQRSHRALSYTRSKPMTTDSRKILTGTHSYAHCFKVLAFRRTCDALRTLQHFYGSTFPSEKSFHQVTILLTCLACVRRTTTSNTTT